MTEYTFYLDKQNFIKYLSYLLENHSIVSSIISNKKTFKTSIQVKNEVNNFSLSIILNFMFNNKNIQSIDSFLSSQDDDIFILNMNDITISLFNYDTQIHKQFEYNAELKTMLILFNADHLMNSIESIVNDIRDNLNKIIRTNKVS